MDGEYFVKEAKQHLAAYLYPSKQNNKHFLDSMVNKMFTVWLSKIGKNNKCLIGIDGSDDYFEVSYFGGEGEFVLDHYTLKKHLYI